MIEINPHLVQPLLKSSLPLLLGGSYHFLNVFFSDSDSQKVSGKNLHFGFFQSHEINQNDGMSSEGLKPDFLAFLDQISFGIYSNFFIFLFMMLLLDGLLKIVKYLWKEEGKSSRLRTSPLSSSTKEWRLFNMISENQIKRIFCYAVIFMVLQIGGLFFSLVVQVEISTSMSHHSALISSQGTDVETISHINQGIPRILEEKELDKIPLQNPSPMVPDKISLSMGNVLSSLSLSVNAMVLSKDKKTAFVTIDFYGTLKIIDISDLHSPLIVNSLSLRVSTDEYRIKSLILSRDEKTLYASNSKDLEIIDISNLRSPKLISETRSKLFDSYQFQDTTPSFKTSLVVSESTKTLYIGGLGLQVYDISDPKKPVLLRTFKNDVTEDKGIAVNEICLSRDENILFIANGSLDVYNISAPREMKQLYSFKTESSPRSLLFDEDGQTVLLLGTSEDDEIILEEADISSLDSFEVKNTFKLDDRSDYSPRFLAVSPSKSKLFIFAYSSLQGDAGLFVFDRIKHTARRNEDNLIEQTFALDFGPDGKTVITASNNQFMTIELFLDYPNSKVFSPSQENLINNVSFPLCDQMQMSADGQYLFALCKVQKNSYLHVLTIWDVKNLSAPIGLYNTQKFISQMRFINNYQTVYLLETDSIMMLDIAKRDEIKLKKSYKLQNRDRNLVYFIPSSDEKTGFIIRNLGEMGSVSFIDLSSDSDTIDVLLTLDLEFGVYNGRLILKDDDKTLILLGKKMVIYDISEISSPRQIAFLPFGVNEPDPDLSAHLLSPDKKILFIETFDENRLFQLKIYNISILTSPELISEKYFPKLQKGRAQPGLSLSPDLKTGYLYHHANSLIKLDLTDLKQPQVTGVIPLVKNKQGSISSYVISPDGKTIYASDSNRIRVINTEIEYTLFLKQEKFLLGGKYSDKIAMLCLSESEYNIMSTESYKIIKLSLLDMKVAPNKVDLEVKTSPLPSWMMFDRESNTLTMESKKQSEIGAYTLHSVFSLKIPREALQDLGTSVPLDDIWAWLISLDYVDPKMYLTENLGEIDTFFLPSSLNGYRKKIYEILQKYRVETCTSFEVVSSLELNNKSLPSISSLSTSPIKVEIKLEPKNGVDAKFVNRPYGSLIPVMKENKTKISLEGAVKEINTAISSIVVNFENGTSCSASMTIMDDLNPPVSRGLTNISRYFKSNAPPSINNHVDKTTQEQIDDAEIQTGKYFTFTFSGDIFEDEYLESLKYEVILARNNTAFPTWLNANGLTLKGTPPEEISGRNIDLILVAKNEFKENQIPFRLHISISAVFWLKLVMKYIPYILTLLGLFVSANKIFNILRKGFYKHSKEFYIGVGEEISENVIFPVSFIREEQKQSQLILKQFSKDVNVTDFLDQGRKILEKEKIISKIKEVVQKMSSNVRKQIRLYPSPIIDQIIVNKFVWMQLDSEKETQTRSLFESLKADCLEVVERDPSSASSGFTINQNKLNKLIKRMQMLPRQRNSTLEESLISHQLDAPEGVNIHLLKDAILAFAFENHSIDLSPISIDIGVRQKVPANFLFRFLKLDLREIYLDYKNKMNYGINYQIIDDKLCFYGVAQNYLKGKTLVVQIKNRKHRIMKEIWIHGVPCNLGKDETSMIRDEQELRGQGYEIY